MFHQLCDRLQVVADEAYDKGDFASLDAGLAEALAGCDTSEELWTILSLDRIDEGTYAEDELPALVADALLDKAAAWAARPDEQAGAIGLALRASAFDPAPYLLKDADRDIKPRYLAAIEARAAFLRDGLASPHAIVRSACAQALAHCRNVVTSDLDLLRARLDGERDVSALAATWLALGATQRRLGASGDPPCSKAVLTAALGKRSLLVKSCSAAAWAISGAALDAKQSAPLTRAVEAPRPLPSEWGWVRTDRNPLATDAIALRVIGWAPIAASGALLKALSGGSKSPLQTSKVLLDLAFAGGAAIPTFGLVLEDLSELQQQAVRGIAAAKDYSAIHKLGLGYATDAEPFLRGEPPQWLPLPVDMPEGKRRWHLWRIWRGCVWDELSTTVAAEAIVRGLEPDALLHALTVERQPLLTQVVGRKEERPQFERELSLYIAVLTRLRENGVDAGPVLDQRCRQEQQVPIALAACIIAWHTVLGSAILAAEESVVARGIHFSSAKDVLREALARLPSR